LKVIEKSLNFNLLALDKMHFIFCTHYQLDCSRFDDSVC